MDRTGIWISWLFAVHVSASMVLAEIWRGKRSKRPNYRKIREQREATMVAWLHAAPTKSTRSHRRTPAWNLHRPSRIG